MKRNQAMYQKRIPLAVVLLLGSLCFGTAGCGVQESENDGITLEPESEQALFETAVADYGDVILSKKLMCTYRQVEDYEACFSVSGKTIDKVYVSAGDVVSKGDLLAELVTGDLDEEIVQTEYELARNQLLLDQNERNLDNEIEQLTVEYTYHTEQTSEDWVAKEKQLAEIRKEHRYLREDYSDAIALAQAQLAVLQKEKAESCLYAAIDGTISTVERELEGSVSVKDEPVITIIDTSECLFELEEADYAAYFREGEALPMTVSVGTGKGDYTLLPYQMESWGDVQLFSIEEQPDGAVLEVGATGNLYLTLDQRENVLRVPEEAVHNADGKDYVYVTDDAGMREVVYVEAGLKGDEYTEILSGIDKGQRVILK